MSAPYDAFLPERIGPYRILKLIATGAMGTVYVAQRDDADLVVALKVPRYHDPHLLARFTQRESRAILQHPNIVEIVEVGQTGEMGKHESQRFIAMRYLPDGSLADELRRLRQASQRMAWPRAVTIAAQIARALAHAHAHGVIHRDVKPGNILFAEDGRAVLTDFGIARVYVDGANNAHGAQDDVLTMLDEQAYTAKYASPEQRRALQFTDARSDIFSLGRVLYEMLAGDVPRDARPLRPLQRVRADVPRVLARITDKATQLDPLRRYQRAEDLAVALERATQATTKPSAPTSARRTRLIAGALVACLLVVSIGVWVAAYHSNVPPTDQAAAPTPTLAATVADADEPQAVETWLPIEPPPTARPAMNIAAPTVTPLPNLPGSPIAIAQFSCEPQRAYTSTVCLAQPVAWQQISTGLQAQFNVRNAARVALLLQPVTENCAAPATDGRTNVVQPATTTTGALTLNLRTLAPGAWRANLLVTRADGVQVTVGGGQCVAGP